MVIKIELCVGDKVEHKLYRNVARHNYSGYVAGFMANRDFYRWGRMYKLTGNNKELVHQFGEV